MARSRRARWSLTCVSRLAAWLAVAGDPPPRLLPCQLRFASCDPLLFAPAGPGAGTVPLSPPVPPSWVSPPFPLLRAALAAPAGTRGVPPTWWAGKKGVPPTRWVLARGALPLSLSGRLPAAPAGEGNANPSISGSKPPPHLSPQQLTQSRGDWPAFTWRGGCRHCSSRPARSALIATA